jgi:hypothetical protein
MIITKKAIPRRTVLRGIGAGLALPLLDSMVPALSAMQNTAAQPVKRLGIVYHPNGIVDYAWNVKEVGALGDFSPILQPIEPFKNQTILLSNLAMDEADAKGDGNGDHARAGGTYLTGVHVRKSETNVEAAISMDQIAAKKFENETQLGSLQLTLDANTMVGSCDGGYSCAYSNTLSWLTTTLPLMSENDPRVVFERLFGASDSTDSKVRAARLRQDRSILDSITARISQLQRELGPGDQRKVDNYLSSIRDVERRIQRAEEQSSRELPEVEKPSGIPSTFEEHAELMYDLQLLAFQCDLTRVITFMYGREITGRTYPALGINESHHSISHHGNDPEKLAKLVIIQTHHMNLLAKFLEKMKGTQDGDGNLLDHSMIMFGAGLSNSDRHSHSPMYTMVVGGGGGTLKGGQHIVYPEHTPQTNLYMTLLEKMGVPVEKIGDSTGKFTELSEMGYRPPTAGGA